MHKEGASCGLREELSKSPEDLGRQMFSAVTQRWVGPGLSVRSPGSKVTELSTRGSQKKLDKTMIP